MLVDDEPRQLSIGPDGRRRLLVLTIVLAVVGSAILVVGMIEEPYHIDELRQVASYSRPITDLVDLSSGPRQPPLDPILGKIVYRVVGEGHIQQRLHPTILGMGVLVLLALLLWRRGHWIAAPVSVLLYSIVPVVVSVTAYARQYALPVFLSLLFLLGADEWLRSRSKWGLAGAFIAAIALPTSRAVDPMFFLAAVVATLVVWTVRRRPATAWERVMPLLAIAGGSFLLVGLPITMRLRAEANDLVASSAGLGERLGRFVTDLPAALAESAVVWPVAVLVLVLVVIVPAGRRFVRREWWVWPLIAIPVGFASSFFLLASPDRSFFLRYTYSWWLPFAVLVAIVVESAALSRHEGRSNTSSAWVIVSVIGLVVVLGFGLVRDLSSDDWVDYEPLGQLIQTEVEPDVVVYFDSLVPLGEYRSPYAGRGRFLPMERPIPPASAIVRDPTVVRPEAGFVVALSGPEIEIEGWRGIRASESMYLYVPAEPRSGFLEAGTALVAFGRAAEADTGVMLRLAGASLFDAAGETGRVCSEVADLLEGFPSRREDILELMRSGPLDAAVEVCLAGS